MKTATNLTLLALLAAALAFLPLGKATPEPTPAVSLPPSEPAIPAPAARIEPAPADAVLTQPPAPTANKSDELPVAGAGFTTTSQRGNCANGSCGQVSTTSSRRAVANRRLSWLRPRNWGRR